MPVPATQQTVAPTRVLLKDVVRDRIRDAIMDGTLEPGEVLRDADLVEWLGVSRTPLRSALDDLEREGLIEMAPNRYTRVATPDPGQIVHAMHTMGVLRSGAVRFAMPDLTPEVNLQLQHMCTQLADAMRRRDLPGMRAFFGPLYMIFIERVTNPLYRERVLGSLDGYRLHMRVAPVFDLVGEDGLLKAAAAADDLREAIASGDVTAARAATELMHLGWIPDSVEET